VRRRRLLPVKFIQGLQVQVQNRVLNPVVSQQPLKVPLFMQVISASPWLQSLTARIIGLGIRAEHVRSPVKGLTPG
jgi:hypothetical protein